MNQLSCGTGFNIGISKQFKFLFWYYDFNYAAGLTQIVEEWTSNSEVGDSNPRLTTFFEGCMDFVLFSLARTSCAKAFPKKASYMNSFINSSFNLKNKQICHVTDLHCLMQMLTIF